MATPNYKQIFAIEKKNKEKWLKIDNTIPDTSGIYILTRFENGLKFGYVGQAKKILTRLAQHLSGYDQHIDLSLKKHKLWSKSNPDGWQVNYIVYPESKLDEKEQYWIKEYANMGYQLRNKTSGSQSEGKFGISDNKTKKGYRDGIRDGRKKLKQELNSIIDKYLVVTTKSEGKLAQNALDKFWFLLLGDN